RIGNVNPSSPLYKVKSSSVLSIISGIASKLPLASFTETILSTSDASLTTVSGSKTLAVRPGTLYIITGKEVDSEIVLKSLYNTSELQSRFDLVCRLLLEK